jgi:hypothetical protein
MLIISFEIWLHASEPMHLGVLRVLTEQTLEISSVVKDSTQPGPSLVTEVKDSSLTILHQFYPSYRWILQVQREEVRNIGGFQQEGRITCGRKIRSGLGKLDPQ